MKFIYVIYTFLVVVLAGILIGFIPIKYAVKQDDLSKTENYIMLKIQKATISEWLIIGNNREIYDVPKDVRLVGKKPSDYNYDVEAGDNTFVCYGKYDGVGDLCGERYDIFNVERWEILYPVKRNSPFNWVLPDSYLCRFDRER